MATNFRSNANHTRLVSKSIFVTNFPDNTSSKDLWKLCQDYGTVVDVYIPNRKSKAGKHFAFVRFIKVENINRLVGNLYTLWIGRMQLHANVVRFKHSSIQASRSTSSARLNHIGASSFATVLKGNNTLVNASEAPAMVIDDSCVVTRDLEFFVMGEVKKFSSIPNLRVLLSNEGFQNVKVVYLGGLWVMFELESLKSKAKFMQHVGVASWFTCLCNARSDFVSRERIVWVDIVGVPLHDWSRATFTKSVLNRVRRSNRRRIPNIVEPEIRTIVEIFPMADRTMEELLQAPTEGYGEAILIPEILAENFEIKTNLLQLVQANKFHGFERDNPYTHISNFKRMTATLKYRDVLNDVIKLMLFPYSLEGAARIWYEKEPPNSILTWDDLVNKFVNQFFPPSKTTHLKNEISRFTQRFEETFGDAWDRFKEMLRACPHHGFLELTQIEIFYNGLTEQDQDSLNAAAGGNLLNKTTRGALKIIKNKSKVRYSRRKSNVSRVNTNSRDVVSKTDDRIDKLVDQISNLVEIVNKQVIAPAKVVEKTCVTCGGAHAYYECIATDSNPSSVCAATSSYNQVSPPNRASHQIPPHGFAPVQNNPNSTAQIQPPVVPISISEPDVPRTQSKPTIPYPSMLNDQKLREQATNQMEKFFQIFHDLHFDISFADALFLMPKFASTIKSLLANKDKLFELAKVPLNENCSAMLLKKLPKKLGDPGKFLIPCDFPRMEVCHALADLRASINLMPLSIWKKLSLPELTPTRMTLELADRSITRPKGVAENVFVKVEKFHFPTDFVVVDFEAKSCSNLREPIVKSSSPTLTPFGESDFFLEEIEDFLNDDSIPTEIENFMCDPEVDILFLEKLLNDDPFQLPPMDLRLAKESKEKSSVEEPPELELKELPSHLEYAFLEDSNKLPVIIAKNLKVDEREALINVLKSHKRVIAWKISDIKVIDPSSWVSPIYCVPKKGGTTVVANENSELIPTRLVTGWIICIDYRKLNDATRKDHFPLPFMDQMLKRLVGKEFYCFLDRGLGYFQIPIDPQDQEKTTFTCPYGTFEYRSMPFGLCNVLGIFQRCMMSIFYDMNEKTMEVFMDDFSVFGDSFSSCLTNLDNMLNLCEETNLVLNWEKCHFMYKEGLVLGHKILKSGIEVDRAKVDVIAKLPHPTTFKGVRSFLGHAGFYRRFIQDFSKIARPMTHLLEKETPFVFSKECIDAFNTLKKKLTEAPILVVPDWNLPFELMCDASDYAIAFEILKACHEGPSGGHHGANLISKKVFNASFFWPSLYRDAHDMIKTCDIVQSAACTDNCALMLEENDYESWKILMKRYIRSKPQGKAIWKSIVEGPASHPMTGAVTGVANVVVKAPRPKRDEEFTAKENASDLADIQAASILSQGPPRHIFNTLNQTEFAKEMWENIELLMKGSSLTEQRKQEELFDEYE
nr:DNA-directed DNA polymerase [Tanacetum cinerariifolium]